MKKETAGGAKLHLSGKKQVSHYLSMAMTEASKNPSMKFIFFDSLTTLLIYNELETTKRFVHYFINKIKNLDILMIIMSVEEEKLKS